MESVVLDDRELKRLYSILKDMFKEVNVRSGYELYRFDDRERGLFVVGYRSGKVVYRDGELFRKFLVEVMEVDKDFDCFLGADEAGKGEWYGPLVVACIALTPNDIVDVRCLGVRDSKLLGRRVLLKLGASLEASSLLKEVVVYMPEEYNRRYSVFSDKGFGMNDLLAEAHASAIKNVLSKVCCRRVKVVVDMFDYSKTDKVLSDLGEGCVVVQKRYGESETAVAAASILAKYVFEKKVDELDRMYGIDLRNSKPENVPVEILPKVAKTHFRNVSKFL